MCFFFVLYWITMIQIGPLTLDFTPLLAAAAQSPLHGMWYLFIHGAWIPMVIAIFAGFKWMWILHITLKAAGEYKWVLLAVDVPAENIQTLKAVENVLAHLAGAHDKPDLIQKYITGFSQPYFSLEIVSTEGHIRSEEHTSELQSHVNLVCRLLLEKK